MSRVQEKAKNERQNDDYATTNTNPNSSSHHDEAHHIRRRLSQTISSRSCLLIAIALASLSAHACDDTVELQVTCDSGNTPWVVPSHITQTDSSDETNPQMVTVGSCIEGRVKDVAQVKGNDIDDKGIVLCAQPKVCYHLKRQSDGKIDVKNCDNYDDPNRTYHCDNGVLKFRNDKSHDITASDTCFSSNNVSHNYGCDGNNIVRKTPCPNGCADDHKGCKQNSDLFGTCAENDTLICKDGALFDCRNSKYIEGGKACNDKGEVVFCKENKLNPEMHTCEGDQVVWCKPNEQNPLQKTDCFPSSQNDKFIACNNLKNTRRICDENGDILPEESCINGQTKCAGDLKGRVDCNGEIINACQYCYNKNVNNTPISIGELGCNGCVPNQYDLGDSNESIFKTMNSICHNGKKFEFNKIKNSKFLSIPQFDRNGLWEFALNVTLALPEVQFQNPPTDQLPKSLQPTWQYYNCHNDDAREQLSKLNQDQSIKTASDFLSKLAKLNKCCQDVNSYYITRTGYRYYSVEKCTNIALQNTNNGASIVTKFSAYAYTPELNGSIIGIEDDLLVKDYACLEVRDNPEDTNDVRRMMFIKQKTNGDQQSRDGELKHGIYKAFECPEDYKCDENLNRLLCMSNNPPQGNSNSNCKCKNNTDDIYTITCDKKLIAACPKGTTPHIVGDNSKCDNQSNLKLDQIRCVPDGKSTGKQ